METELNVQATVVSAMIPGRMKRTYSSPPPCMLPPTPYPKASRYSRGPTRPVTRTSGRFSLM